MDSNSQDLCGISRLDQESTGTCGWQVRIQRKGVRYGRFFSDVDWGGTERALSIAIQYRDKIIAHHERNSSPIRSHKTTGSRNQSGVIGVTRILQRSAKGDEYHFWQANWTDSEGNRQSVRYSVLKLGDELAFEMACVARKEALKA